MRKVCVVGTRGMMGDNEDLTAFQWFEHVDRVGEERPAKKVYKWEDKASKRKGRRTFR